MKFYVCLVLLVCVDIHEASEVYWVGNVHGDVNPSCQYHVRTWNHKDENNQYDPHIDHDDHHSHHYHDDYHLDHIDDHHHILRPCSTHDVNCIRRFLVHNVKCSPRYIHGSGPFILKRLTFDIPLVNISITINNAELRSLNAGKIKEFYIDKKTGTLVLEVVFDRFEVYSPLTTLTYYRPGKAPIEASDQTLIEFRLLSLTWSLRVTKEKRVISHVYAYLGDQTVFYQGGPGLNNNGLESINNSSTSLMPMQVRQALVRQAPVYMDAFLQQKVCKLPNDILSSE